MNHQHGHPSLQDELFIRGIIAGGAAAEQAMKDLYLLYRKKVLAYIVSMIRRYPEFKGQPEDLMHDAFIVLVQRVEISDGHIRSLFSFWLGITKHLLLNHMRRDERVILVQEPAEDYFSPEESNEDKFLESEAADQLQHTFDQLGSRCREILLLWIERYTMEQIARKLKLSGPPMARKIKHECYKKLKNLVRDGNKSPGP